MVVVVTRFVYLFFLSIGFLVRGEAKYDYRVSRVLKARFLQFCAAPPLQFFLVIYIYQIFTQYIQRTALYLKYSVPEYSRYCAASFVILLLVQYMFQGHISNYDGFYTVSY